MWSDISLWALFAFLCWLVMLSIFSCACWPFWCPLWKIVCVVLLPILNQIVLLLLSCISSLYILNMNSLFDIWFAKFFSYSVGCPFILFMISFVVQKFWIWCGGPICFNLFIFYFFDFVVEERNLNHSTSKRFTGYFFFFENEKRNSFFCEYYRLGIFDLLFGEGVKINMDLPLNY